MAGHLDVSCVMRVVIVFFFSSRRRHTRLQGDWSSDVCSSDLGKWVWEIKQSGGSPFAGYATTGVASTNVSRSIGDRKSVV